MMSFTVINEANDLTLDNYKLCVAMHTNQQFCNISPAVSG